MIVRRATGFCVALALSVFFALSPRPSSAQGDASEDESLISLIRLAARGGDMDLAHERLATLKKPRLIGIGKAALSHELSLAGDAEQAEELMAEAIEVIETGEMRSLERVQAFLYIARLLSDRDDQRELAIELIDRASEQAGRLAGIDFNLAMAELASTVITVSGDRQQAYDLLQLMTDDTLREKLITGYNLSDLAG